MPLLYLSSLFIVQQGMTVQFLPFFAEPADVCVCSFGNWLLTETGDLFTLAKIFMQGRLNTVVFVHNHFDFQSSVLC